MHSAPVNLILQMHQCIVNVLKFDNKKNTNKTYKIIPSECVKRDNTPTLDCGKVYTFTEAHFYVKEQQKH